MKGTFLALIILTLFVSACAPAPNIGSAAPPFVDTGIDPNSWATVPAGEFPLGQHNHRTMVDYDYQIMVTDVTNEQFASFLNEALSAGVLSVGEVEVDAGEVVRVVEGVKGFYPGDPFGGFRHEEVIEAGDKIYIPLEEDGLRIEYDGEQFIPIPEYANHPMTMVSWFGANAYCEFYDWRLPGEIEWEKAARGTDLVDDHGYPFPWGIEIEGNNANYYSSFDIFEKLFGKLGNTTPVGFYNGRSYTIGDSAYKTLDSASPYGLYDMAGNVWQWTGDDYDDEHYRYMRGGSYFSYEVDLRVWKNNSAHPVFFSPDLGFRCSRDS